MKRSNSNMTFKMLMAGLIGLPLFLIGVGIAGLFAPGYHWISGHGSELGLVPGLASILFKATIIPWGLSFVVFGIGLLRLSNWRSVGAVCWILFGVAMCSNGIWPMGSPMHGLYSISLASLIAPALCMAEIDQIRSIKGIRLVTVVVSVAGIFYLWLNFMGLDPEAYRGLTQRLFSSTNSFWPFFVGWWALRTSR